jgi:hypothetical protein
MEMALENFGRWSRTFSFRKTRGTIRCLRGLEGRCLRGLEGRCLRELEGRCLRELEGRFGSLLPSVEKWSLSLPKGSRTGRWSSPSENGSKIYHKKSKYSENVAHHPLPATLHANPKLAQFPTLPVFKRL